MSSTTAVQAFSTLLLASVQIQKDLIGREKKLGFVQWGHRALVVLWKALKGLD